MRFSHDLKSYVRKYPDNQMAWYLLGKEYERDGQEAKANYCFERSASVYEAFERNKAPTLLWMDYKEKWLEIQEKKRRGHTRRRSICLLLLCTFLLLIPSAAAPGMRSESHPVEDWTSEINNFTRDERIEEAGTFSSSTVHAAGSEIQYLAAPILNKEIKNEVTGLILNKAQYAIGHTIIVDMPKKQEYLYWPLEAELAYRMTSNGAGGVFSETWIDDSCSCLPSERNSSLQAGAEKWASRQVQAVVLLSAITTFQEKNGRVPEQFDELIEPFPNNILAGTSLSLKKLFIELLAYAKDNEKEFPGSSNTYTDNWKSQMNVKDGAKAHMVSFEDTWGGEPALQSPIQIVINKNTHRLMVLSGNVVLRSYEVGLGGEQTPEGNFVISEKVVNPNGTSNGEFGSRGMQLSDTNYAIHGTNKPDSVGKDESLGCIRMKQMDVEELFSLVPKGTKVTIVKDPMLPQDLWVPAQAEDRFRPKLVRGQSNPDKTYHWLN